MDSLVPMPHFECKWTRTTIKSCCLMMYEINPICDINHKCTLSNKRDARPCVCRIGVAMGNAHTIESLGRCLNSCVTGVNSMGMKDTPTLPRLKQSRVFVTEGFLFSFAQRFVRCQLCLHLHGQKRKALPVASIQPTELIFQTAILVCFDNVHC